MPFWSIVGNWDSWGGKSGENCGEHCFRDFGFYLLTVGIGRSHLIHMDYLWGFWGAETGENAGLFEDSMPT
jgi:hypothetical protein